MTLTERLIKVFQNVFEDDTLEVTPLTTANDIEGWDSLSHINLIVAVEIEFEIEFKQKEAMSFANVGDLITLIEKKISRAD